MAGSGAFRPVHQVCAVQRELLHVLGERHGLEVVGRLGGWWWGPVVQVDAGDPGSLHPAFEVDVLGARRCPPRK